jgi:hypothetical protein
VSIPDDYIEVPLAVPPKMRAFLAALAKQGILGSTVEEVVVFIVRQELFRITPLPADVIEAARGTTDPPGAER